VTSINQKSYVEKAKTFKIEVVAPKEEEEEEEEEEEYKSWISAL